MRQPDYHILFGHQYIEGLHCECCSNTKPCIYICITFKNNSCLFYSCCELCYKLLVMSLGGTDHIKTNWGRSIDITFGYKDSNYISLSGYKMLKKFFANKIDLNKKKKKLLPQDWSNYIESYSNIKQTTWAR